MRHLYIVACITCLTLFWAPASLEAQTPAELHNEVVESIGRGLPNRLARYLNTRVEITIDGVRREYTATQARYVLTRFFQQRAPYSFKLINSGQTGGMVYGRIDYRSRAGSYWVTFFMRGPRVTQLRFDPR